jgi:DNA-binding Xre family transcriptional regulator
MIRNLRSTSFSKFGSKASTKKLKKLSPSLKERTITVLKLAEGLGLTEAGVKLFEDTGRSSEQQQ